MKRRSIINRTIALVALAFLSLPASGRSVSGRSYVSQPSRTAASGDKGKVLVAYFTRPEADGVDASSGASRVVANGKLYGNTEYVARMIAQATGGDLFAIETSKEYPASHRALVDAAKREAEANERPELTTHIRNMDDYDIVFVGYPNWWYDMPMVIYSFFDAHDFSGKTVIPFVTHGGSRFSQSVKTISELEKNARVIQGPAVASANAPEAAASIESWIRRQEIFRK